MLSSITFDGLLRQLRCAGADLHISNWLNTSFHTSKKRSILDLATSKNLLQAQV